MKKQTQSIEGVKAKIQQAQEQLEAGLKSLQTSDDWRHTLERMAILGPTSINRFSFRNIILLMSQRPHVTHAATFNAWHRAGRHVKKGEKGLVVLRPRIVNERETDAAGTVTEGKRIIGFSYLTVFALEQTDGEAIAAPMQPKALVDTPEGFTWTVEALTALVKTIPGVAGITFRARQPGDHARAAGWFNRITKQIVIIDSAPRIDQFTTVLHEVAHAVLHGDTEHHARPTMEVEAESTAFVVAHALGLDTSCFSFPYVAGWASATDEKEPFKAVAAVGERIRKGAATILGVLFPEATESADELAERAA